MTRVSFLLPAYNEAGNVRAMVERIERVAAGLRGCEVECVFVDDRSRDDTPRVLAELARERPWVRFARLARNSGSHTAIACGLTLVRGDCAIILASDGQDPPELAPDLLARWRAGSAIVWGVRRAYRQSPLDRAAARTYRWLMNRLSEVRVPERGADMVLLDRRVVDAVNQTDERTSSFWELVTWLGFEQASIPYDKAERTWGRSGWTFRKKLRAALDSLLTFSHAPIALISAMGFVVSLTAFLVAMLYLVNSLTGGLVLGPPTVPGWASLFVTILFIGGVQLLMLGIIGEYMWRVLDQVRGRPRFVIEASAGGEAWASDRPSGEAQPIPAGADVPDGDDHGEGHGT
ncbi:MAG: glycosyltransferase family 2 protein [Planctomycetes bacterium]|nr:glycosyltransferase family 2 protein [Planctomycetota bacterium]